MATRPILTDAEAAEAMDRLMDEMFPGRAERAAALAANGRTLDESLKLLAGREKERGFLEMPDEDFARDVEEGRRLMRAPMRDLWD